MRSRRQESNNGSSMMPIVLILGLAFGIPAVIGVGILVVMFALGFFAMKAGQALHEEALAAHEENMARQQVPNPAKQKATPRPIAPAGVPGKNMIDLLALIDPSKDRVHGDRWEFVNLGAKELHNKGDGFVPRMQIPYQPPAEYDFIVVFSQPGLRNGISLIMPNPLPKPNAESFFFYLGSGNGNLFGFHANPRREGRTDGLIEPNTAYTATVQVRRNGVKALLDGRELIHHPTDFQDLLSDNWRDIRDKSVLAIACDDPTVFHYVRVVEFSGPGKRTR